MNTTKRCKRCGFVKKETEFKHGRNICIECISRYKADYQHRYRDSGRGLEVQANYQRTEKGKRTMERWHEKNPTKKRLWARTYRSNKIVREKVCSLCGESEKKIHAHHNDYRKIYSVEFLCPQCHKDRHFIKRDIRKLAIFIKHIFEGNNA